MLRTLLAACIACGAASASAQTYPDRPVRIIVPFAPGGSTDVVARVVADDLSTTFNKQFIVENRPGAAGTTGIDVVAKAKADGYTLGLSGVGPTAIIPMIDPRLSYKPDRDLTTISYLTAIDLVLVARPDLPSSDSLASLLAYAKANPGKITYASTGVAGPVHYGTEYLARLTGVEMLHIPYAGDSQVVTALLSGQIDVGYLTVAGGLSYVQAGKLKALAVGGPKRSDALPTIPTVAEVIGRPEYSAYTWNVLVTAKAVPADIVRKLNEAVAATLAKPAVRARFEQLGLIPGTGDAGSAEAFVASEIEKYRKIIAATGIKRE